MMEQKDPAHAAEEAHFEQSYIYYRVVDINNVRD